MSSSRNSIFWCFLYLLKTGLRVPFMINFKLSPFFDQLARYVQLDIINTFDTIFLYKWFKRLFNSDPVLVQVIDFSSSSMCLDWYFCQFDLDKIHRMILFLIFKKRGICALWLTQYSVQHCIYVCTYVLQWKVVLILGLNTSLHGPILPHTETEYMHISSYQGWYGSFST